jgi:hypothetical protein
MRNIRRAWGELSPEKKLSVVVVPIVVAVIAAVLPGVVDGGDSSDTATPTATATPTPAAVTLQRWVAEANEACEDANGAVKVVPRPRRGDVEAVGLNVLVDNGRQVLSISERLLEDLQRLPAPHSRTETVTAFLRLLADVNEEEEDTLALLEARDAAGVLAAIPRVSRAGSAFDDAAKEIGATSCARGSSFTGLDIEQAIAGLSRMP